VIRPALEEFDVEMRQVLADWLGVSSLNERAYLRATMPLRQAGLGLASSLDLVMPAFAASVAAYLLPTAGPALCGVKPDQLLQQMRNNTANNAHNRDAIHAYDTLVVPAIQAKQEAQRKAGASPSSFPLAPLVEKKFAKESYTITTNQQELTEAAYAKRAEQLCASNLYDATTITMCQSPGATGWLQALPTERALRIPHKDFMSLVRAFIGISPIEIPMPCICGRGAAAASKQNAQQACAEGAATEEQEEEGDKFVGTLKPNDDASVTHLTACKQLGGTTARHDSLVQELNCLCRSIPGIVTRVETNGIIPNRRADLTEYSARYPHGIIYDISVTDPHIEVNLKYSADTRLYAATLREEAKRTHWKDSEKYGFKFCPIVFEATGGQGRLAQLAIKHWCHLADAAAPYEAVNWNAPTRYSYVSQRLSVRTVCGGARAARKVLAKATRDYHHRPGNSQAAQHSKKC
jgi:hypothetical protein